MMKMLQKIVLLSSLYLLWSVQIAQAQTIEPGLWEIQHDMHIPDQPNLIGQMQQLQQQMQHLPAEALKFLEQQTGLSVMPDGAIRICISPEEARAALIQEGQQEGDCTFTKVEHQGNIWRGQMVCTQPPSRGDFTTTVHSNTHYSTVATLTSEEHGRIDVNTQARRISSECDGAH